MTGLELLAAGTAVGGAAAGAAAAEGALGAGAIGAGLAGVTSPLLTAGGMAGAFGPQIGQAAGLAGILSTPATPMFTLGEGLAGAAGGLSMPALGNASLGGLAAGSPPGGVNWEQFARMGQLLGNDQQQQQAPPMAAAPPLGRPQPEGSFSDLLRRRSFGPRF